MTDGPQCHFDQMIVLAHTDTNPNNLELAPPQSRPRPPGLDQLVLFFLMAVQNINQIKMVMIYKEIQIINFYQA